MGSITLNRSNEILPRGHETKSSALSGRKDHQIVYLFSFHRCFAVAKRSSQSS